MSPSRRNPAPTIASARGSRRELSLSLIASTASPISSGIRIVIPIASQAKTSEPITWRRYGRKKPSKRRKVAMISLYKVK